MYAAALAVAAFGLGLASGTSAVRAAAGAGGTPVERSSPSPAPAADKTAARALALIGELQQGTLDRSELTSSLNALLTDSMLAGYRHDLGPLGSPLRAVLQQRTRDGDAIRYVYRVWFSSAIADLTFGIDDGSGKISALYLRAGPPT